MSPWALFAYGQSKPPQTRWRRILWTCAVFVVCAALASFVIVGVVEYWSGGEPLAAVMMFFLAGILLFGVGAATYAFIDLARTTPAGAETRQPRR